MKKRLFVVFILVFLSPISAFALGVNVLSENHHIWGNAGYQNSNVPGVTYDEYDITSDQYVSATIEGYGPDYSYFDGTELNISTASAGNFGINLSSSRWDANAFGESTYILSSDSEMIEISASGGAYQTHGMDSLTISLLDLTTGLYLYNYTTNGYLTSWNGFSLVYGLYIETDHTYQLHMYAESTSGDSPAESWLNVNISALPSPAPEPTSILLIGAGLLSYIGIKRKRTKI